MPVGKWLPCAIMVVVILVLVALLVSTRERYTTLPHPKDNTVIFDVRGHNYDRPLLWFTERGEHVTPSKAEVDYENMHYRFYFYRPNDAGLCDLKWILVTSEDIVPRVTEAITGKEMDVERFERGWLVSC